MLLVIIFGDCWKVFLLLVVLIFHQLWQKVSAVRLFCRQKKDIRGSFTSPVPSLASLPRTGERGLNKSLNQKLSGKRLVYTDCPLQLSMKNLPCRRAWFFPYSLFTRILSGRIRRWTDIRLRIQIHTFVQDRFWWDGRGSCASTSRSPNCIWSGIRFSRLSGNSLPAYTPVCR